MTTHAPSRRGRYGEEEVRALVEEYAGLSAERDTTRGGIRRIVYVADLDRALEQLPDDYWGVVLLHGLIGFSQFETARFLQVSQQAVSKRYRRGLEEITYYINGGE